MLLLPWWLLQQNGIINIGVTLSLASYCTLKHIKSSFDIKIYGLVSSMIYCIYNMRWSWLKHVCICIQGTTPLVFFVFFWLGWIASRVVSLGCFCSCWYIVTIRFTIPVIISHEVLSLWEDTPTSNKEPDKTYVFLKETQWVANLLGPVSI